MEQKYQIGNEYGTIRWDVGALLAHAEEYPVVERPTAELARRCPFHGDPDWAMRTDPAAPGVLVQLREGVDWLIDGNHRLYKASRLGLPVFRCRYLRSEEHQRFIEGFDPEVYRAVVASWL